MYLLYVSFALMNFLCSNHDIDKDGTLDGIEILNAIQHTLYHETDEFMNEYQLGVYVGAVLKYATGKPVNIIH